MVLEMLAVFIHHIQFNELIYGIIQWADRIIGVIELLAIGQLYYDRYVMTLEDRVHVIYRVLLANSLLNSLGLDSQFTSCSNIPVF